MDWLKRFYDKVLLLVVSLLAIAAGAFLLLKGTSFGANFPEPVIEKKRNLDEIGRKATELHTEKLGSKVTWRRKEVANGVLAPLTASVPIVELEDGSIVNMLSTEDTPLRSGEVDVPNKWLFENDIDYTRSDALLLDPDNDGFSNEEEYVAKTDPQDPDDHPPYISQLRLAERGEDPFVIKMGAFLNPQFQIMRVEPNRKNWFFAVGDSFPDSGDDEGRFTIEEHIPKTDPNGRDISELVISDSVRTEDSPFTVVRNIEHNRPIYFAKFVYKHRGETPIERVEKGESFTLPNQATPVYTLKEIREDYAVVTYTPEGTSSPTEARIPLDN
ncbi:hypothetical protein BH23VER1_BH23VER1_29110 [soil metagenome]